MEEFDEAKLADIWETSCSQRKQWQMQRLKKTKGAEHSCVYDGGTPKETAYFAARCRNENKACERKDLAMKNLEFQSESLINELAKQSASSQENSEQILSDRDSLIHKLHEMEANSLAKSKEITGLRAELKRREELLAEQRHSDSDVSINTMLAEKKQGAEAVLNEQVLKFLAASRKKNETIMETLNTSKNKNHPGSSGGGKDKKEEEKEGTTDDDEEEESEGSDGHDSSVTSSDDDKEPAPVRGRSREPSSERNREHVLALEAGLRLHHDVARTKRRCVMNRYGFSQLQSSVPAKFWESICASSRTQFTCGHGSRVCYK